MSQPGPFRATDPDPDREPLAPGPAAGATGDISRGPVPIPADPARTSDARVTTVEHDPVPDIAVGALPAAGEKATSPVTPPLSRRRRAGILITLILGGLTALPPLSMDLYLPALPEIGGVMDTGAANVQLTLTACLLGLGLGQLITGPMSDQLGRRKPLIAGMICYIVASAACAFATSIEMLIVFRTIQGLAGAAGVVIARAVVRDMFDGLAMARFFSTLLLISGVAPILAPVVGGQLLRFTSWRGLFILLAVGGVVLVLIVVRLLPETLPPERRTSGGIGPALRDMRELCRDRVFLGHLLTCSFAFAALFAYVAASPFVVQELYGASPQTFSLLFMVNSMGLIAMSQVNGRILVGRVSLNAVIVVGLVIIGLSAVALLLMTLGVFGEVGLLPLAVALFVLMSAMALVLPNSNSEALLRTPHAAGSASALLGAAQFFIGAVASPLVGVAGEDTAVPMAVVQLTTTVIAAVSFFVLCRPWQRTTPSRTADLP
ncbi:multidrug effflux MFS transporter [Streptomyces calidiresistens]|uniref:Bcr/CflA family efflux MFS transporter n=1 Tax=Streptomyces calidiresistens TaxID=1485586 RepID=A0A7W3T4Y0_9ACTN|nr:multidrug effflux MFS transporter [Streptomyces calidiresistens]MBB0230741.1 Bcr/CflA family efflux MFS transporter [Streptomyces calidiresistens]